MSTRLLFIIMILAFASLAGNGVIFPVNPVITGKNSLRSFSNSTSSQGLVVDIYTDREGRGQNVSIGAYTIGDQIKFYLYVSQNCSIKLELITPNGSVWLRMAGPETAGTFVDYEEAQYPTGTWEIVAVASQGSKLVTETASFEVIEKATKECTNTYSLNSSAIEETKFDGKIVNVYLYSVGGIYGWDVLVERTYFGPDITNLTVSVKVTTYSETANIIPDLRPGYVDNNITLGDRVEVYGLLSQSSSKISVTLNGSENYYIKKLSTLCESPQLILFTREVFPSNLLVRIDGTAIAADRNDSITKLNWNWGDGQSSDQQFPATHTYAQVGTYLILVKAFQSDGLSTTKSISITVPTNTFPQSTEAFPSSATTGGTTSSAGATAATELEVFLLAITIVAIALASIIVAKSRMNRPTQLDAWVRALASASWVCSP